ncbi:hypothetical protein [Deinococcus knuensis]|uniref:Uncharacterized protein n=1 Tax=Deinococcus knuensis TaxID=1837380 RepID=A0ABQ2SDG7_9DEIO|nr:hypothetical protein [Deinococcus knuensis]GGS22223.1 hypothetical protein GCM10008961_12140 [Deinococcus knuensis]
MKLRTLTPIILLAFLMQTAPARSGSLLHQTGIELSSVRLQVIEQLRVDANKDLPASFTHHPNYQIWKDHPAYIGMGLRDGDRVATYSLSTFTRAGGLLKLQNRLREIYNDESVRIEGLQSSLTWGEGMTTLQVLFEAGKLGIIRPIQGGGLSVPDGRLIVRLYDMKDAEQTVAVLTAIGIDPEMVDFEIDLLEGRATSTGEDSPKKAGH